MRRSLIVILALTCALVAAPPALADSSQRLYDDCQDNGQIDGTYTQRQFQKALSDLPSDLDEYTDCRDVIRRGQLAAAGGGHGGGAGGIGGGGAGGIGGGGGGAAGAAPAGPAGRDPLSAATPQERKAFEAARRAGAQPVQLGGAVVRPGDAGAGGLAGAGHDLPLPVLVLLALVAAALLAGGANAIWSRVSARRAG